MAVSVRLPQLAANVEEATVGEWKRAEGEAVRAGEPLVEIITSKATFDLESPADGLLLRRVAPSRSIVPVGYVLALIGRPGEPAPDVAAANEALMSKFRSKAAAAEKELPAKLRATPGARRLAKEAGVDLTELPLAGTDVIREEDVRKYLEQHPNS
jgi:pyruvate/2-oxoglutarate dehydrogenase complex dihydrolipoamide acyltransferase (E2) component